MRGRRLKDGIRVGVSVSPQVWGIACGIAAAVGWGVYIAATRHGVADGLTASDLTFIRFATAGVIIAPWALIRLRNHNARLNAPKVLALSFLAGPPLVALVVGGNKLAPLASGVMVELAAVSIVCILLARWWLGESLDRVRLVGLSLLVVRMAALAGPSLISPSTKTLGIIMFVGAGCMFAIFAALVRRWRVEPLMATAIVSIASLGTYAPYYALTEPFARICSVPSLLLIEQMVGQGLIAGIGALTAFSVSVRLLGLVRAAFLSALTPLVAAMAAVFLLGEQQTLWHWTLLSASGLGALLLVLRTQEQKEADRASSPRKLVPPSTGAIWPAWKQIISRAA